MSDAPLPAELVDQLQPVPDNAPFVEVSSLTPCGLTVMEVLYQGPTCSGPADKPTLFQSGSSAEHCRSPRMLQPSRVPMSSFCVFSSRCYTCIRHSTRQAADITRAL